MIPGTKLFAQCKNKGLQLKNKGLQLKNETFFEAP